MRVQKLIALCSVVAVATTACGKHELMAPNGHGNKAEIPANVTQLVPENVFPLAKRYAGDCEGQQDLASCNYLAWMLSEGMAVPPEHADETDSSIEDSYHIQRKPDYAPVEQNIEAANALFAAACEAGWPSACLNLQRAGVAEDGAAVLSKACAQGEVGACQGLADIAQAGGLGDITPDAIEAQLEKQCNAGRSAACEALTQVSSNIGKSTEAAVANPVLLEISKRSRSAAVVVYTDDAAEGNAVAQRAREAFGADTTVEIRPAQGVVDSGWLQSVPELLVLAQGVPSSAKLVLKKDDLSLTSVIADSTQASAVRDALTRIGGERQIVANLDPIEAETEEAAEAAN